MNREAWRAAVHGSQRVGYSWATVLNWSSPWWLSDKESACQYRYVSSIPAYFQWCLILCDPTGHNLPRLLCPWNFPSRNTGVGCHFLLQGIFPTQGSNPGLLCLCIGRQILYQLHHRSPGEANGNPFQYSCLGNLTDRSLVGDSPWLCKRVGHDLVTKQTHYLVCINSTLKSFILLVKKWPIVLISCI